MLFLDRPTHSFRESPGDEVVSNRKIPTSDSQKGFKMQYPTEIKLKLNLLCEF